MKTATEDNSLPIITLTRTWEPGIQDYAYKVKLYHAEKEDVPVIATKNKKGIGVVFQLTDGDFITKSDLKILVTEATGYIFDVVNPPGTETNPEGLAEFKKILEQAGGAAGLDSVGRFENETATVTTVTPDESVQILEDMERAAREEEARRHEAEEEEEEEEPDPEGKGL